MNSPSLTDAESIKTKVIDRKRQKIARHLDAFKGPLERFVTEDWSRELWRRDDIAKIFPTYSSAQIQIIARDLLVVMTVLTCIVWPFDSTTFKTHFLDRKEDQITDDTLPFYGELGFLGAHEYQFRDTQLIFKPCVITTNRVNTTVYPANRPWAFIDLESLSQGSGGEIYKATVAPKYFTNDEGFVNKKPKTIAYKKFHKAADPEVNNIAYLRESISDHKSIQLHLGAILRGDDFHIFLPWTPLGDLEVLLHGGLDPAAETTTLGTTKYTFEEEFPDATEIHFVGQLRQLGDAIKYLHNDLVLRDNSAHHFYCAHNDLRPRNILVYPPEQNFPLGKWMITDFGISSFGFPGEEDSRPQRFDYPTVGNLARARQEGSLQRVGAHFAPELNPRSQRKPDPRKCDVWSFGCISADVLAFVVGGLDHRGGDAVKQAVASAQAFRKRKNGDDDYFYRNPGGEDQYDGISEDARLRPEVCEWLSELRDRFTYDRLHEHEWVVHVTELIRAILVIDPKDRINALELKDTLEKISRAMQQPRACVGILGKAKSHLDPARLEARPKSPMSIGTERTELSGLSSRPETPLRLESPFRTPSPLASPRSSAPIAAEVAALNSPTKVVYKPIGPATSTRTPSKGQSSNSGSTASRPSQRSRESNASTSGSSLLRLGTNTQMDKVHIPGYDHGQTKQTAVSSAADKIAYLKHPPGRPKRWYIIVRSLDDLTTTATETELPELPLNICWDGRWTDMKIASDYVTVSGLTKGKNREYFRLRVGDPEWQRLVPEFDEERLCDIIPSGTGQYALITQHAIVLREHGKSRLRRLPRQRATFHAGCFSHDGRYLISWWWSPGKSEQINHEICFWDTEHPDHKTDRHCFTTDAKRHAKPSLLPFATIPACMIRIEESQQYSFVRAGGGGSPTSSVQAFSVPRLPIYDSLPTVCGDLWRISIVPKPRATRKSLWQSEYEVRHAHHRADGTFDDEGKPLEMTLKTNSYQMAAAEVAGEELLRLLLVGDNGEVYRILIPISRGTEVEKSLDSSVMVSDFAFR